MRRPCLRSGPRTQRRRLLPAALLCIPLVLACLAASQAAVPQAAVPPDTAVEAGSSGRGVWQGTYEYWRSTWHVASVWLGLSFNNEQLQDLPEPVERVWRFGRPSREEFEEVHRQQILYYHDDSARSVRVTLWVSVPLFAISLLAFEFLMRGRPGGFRHALGVPRLAFPTDLFDTGWASAGGWPRGMPDPTLPAASRQVSESDSSSARRWARRAQQALRRQVRFRTAEMLRAVLTIDEEKVLESAGFDALMMLRFCALCGRFCALACMGGLLLAPLYSRGGGSPEPDVFGIGFSNNSSINVEQTSLNRFTLANLQPGCWSLWAVVPVAYGCTFALCGLLWKEYERFVLLRRFYLGGEGLSLRGVHSNTAPMDFAAALASEYPWQRGLTPPALVSESEVGPGDSLNSKEIATSVEQMRRTVMVERLPPELQEPNALWSCFEELLGPGTVHSVAVVPPDARRLSEMLRERQQLLREEDWERDGELAVLDEHLRSRREEFARLVTGPRCTYLRSGPGVAVSSQLSELGELRERLGVDAMPSLESDDPEDTAARSCILRDRLERPQQLPPVFKGAWASAPDPLHLEAEERGGAGGPGIGPCASPPMIFEPKAPFGGRVTLPRRLGQSWASSNSDEALWAGEAADAPSRGSFVRPSSFRELCTAASLFLRTAVRSLLYTVCAMAQCVREGVGTTVTRMGQLLPGSSWGTPAPGSARATPFPEFNWPSMRSPAEGHMGSSRSCSSTAFVTLRTLQAACIACKVVLDEDPMLGSELVATQAPEPRDVLWHNAARPQAQCLVRQFFVEVAMYVGLAFWSVPVSLLQAWCSLARLQSLLGPSLQLPEHFVNSDIYSLLTLYLPVMALLALLEVLPGLLYGLASRYEGIKSRSALQMLTMQRYWRFQVATIAVTALSGSLSNSWNAIKSDPSSVLWHLGQSLPKVSVYFLVTVLSSALVVAPVSLLRLPVCVRALAATLRQAGCCCCRRHAWLPTPTPQHFLQSPDHAADLSALLLVLLVCVTYANVAPLILPAGLIFFVVKWCVLAVQYLYVFVPRFDSGGAFWPLLWNQALLALMLGNLTTLALVGLRRGYAQLPFLLPLPLLPFGFKLRTEYRFAEPSRRLSLRLARLLDARDPRLADRFAQDAYWHPALRFSNHDLRASLHHKERERASGPLDALVERFESDGEIST